MKLNRRIFVGVLLFLVGIGVQSAPVRLVEQPPAQIRKVGPGVYLVDFGQVAFGNLRLTPPAGGTGKITVHFGEAFADGRINRKPPGSVRYVTAILTLDGTTPVIVAPSADMRNTEQVSASHPPAVLTPPEWGVVLPFRWVELEGWPGELRPDQIRRRAAFASDWKDQAADFHCSDEMLNRIWDLCRYSIKASTFAGVYVDGDRERIPYEGDAYLTQLSRYYCDGDAQMARDTFDRLMTHPTWPSEWASHMIFMAYADWMQTGDTNWLAAHYSALKSKLFLDRKRGGGLVVSPIVNEDRKYNDLVDWPAGERDGYEFTSVNTVINAFHLRTLTLMSRLARALHQDADADDFTAQERIALAAFQEKLFDPARGLYRDGEGTDHCSLHANLFPLAFGLVPDDRRAYFAEWLANRGMKCSVYAAQYLVEGLFEGGQATQAIAMMTAPGDRSWKHMVESGTTITWEAWDQRYKPNQDWNHGWGAAPANLLPRFVLGVRPLAPGYSRILIAPQLGPLKWVAGKVPTPRGPVTVKIENAEVIRLEVEVPQGATVDLPVRKQRELLVDGQRVKTAATGSSLTAAIPLGRHVIESR